MPTDIEFPLELKVNTEPYNSVDLHKLVVLLDAARCCGDHECESCKQIYNSGNECPLWINKENSLNAVIAIEKYLDDKYDKEEKVRGDKLVKILMGEEV